MRIGKTAHAYRAAEGGTADNPPDALIRRVQGVRRWRPLVAQAVVLIFECRHHSANERGFNAPNAWKLLEAVAGSEEEHHALLRIAIYYAKQDMRYWVADPSTMSYCSVCRRQKELEKFPPFNRWKCRRCCET